jgi:hypothetical protein
VFCGGNEINPANLFYFYELPSPRYIHASIEVRPSPPITVIEPPAVHSTANGNDKRIGSPTGPDCDSVVREFGKEVYTEICPGNAKAAFSQTKEPQPLRLRRCPPPADGGDGYHQPEFKLQSDSSHGQWNGNQRQPEVILTLGKQRTEGRFRALCRDVHP